MISYWFFSAGGCNLVFQKPMFINKKTRSSWITSHVSPLTVVINVDLLHTKARLLEEIMKRGKELIAFP